MMNNTYQIEVPKTIILIGMMGAGKTCIGRRLAKRLDLPFTDSDQEVEAAAGCSIQDIYEVYGENVFKDTEKRVVRRVLDNDIKVLSTGGGTYMDTKIRETIKEKAITVWIKAEYETLLPRVLRRDHRPQLKDGSPEDTLKSLIAEYYPVYEEADIIVSCDNSPPDQTTDKIIQEIERYLSKLQMEKNAKIRHSVS